MSRRTTGGYQPTDAGPIPEPPRSGSIALSKQTKLRKVMTISTALSDAAKFDERVNKALADGWYLVKRYTITPAGDCRYSSLVAELQRFDDYDE